MDTIDVVLVSAGILEFFLGFAILLRNNKSPVNLSYAAFSFWLGAWAVGIAFFRSATDVNSALFWSKIYYIAGELIATSLLFFAYYFPDNKQMSTKKLLLISIPTAVLTICLAIPSFLTHEIILQKGGNDIVLGKWEYFIYSIYFLPVLYGALYILWKKYQKATGLVKSQLLYVLLGTLGTSFFGVVFDLILPWFGNYSLIFVGPPTTMLIFLALSYAILRHKLWDFKLVFARVIIYSLLILIIASIYSLVFYAISIYVLGSLSLNVQIIAGGFLTFIAAFAFQPLRTIITVITGKVFFKNNYNSEILLPELGHIMSSNIELKPLCSLILEKLASDMKIIAASIVLIKKENVYDQISVGNDISRFTYFSLVPLINQQNIVIFDELEEGELKQLMRQLDLTISVLLKVKDEKIGLLLLSEKASGDSYNDQDLKVLNIISPEAAVAIRNALSYEEIKRFNITLAEEVERATRQLKVANLKLKELDQLKDDFVSIASHELRTPMTAIKSYLWMALKKSDIPITDKMNRYLSRAFISTERLINLVNDMLNVSRIEAGRIEIKPKEFDIIALADEVVSMVSPKATEKQIKIEIQKVQIPKVFADQDKVNQILLNLLGNALKFTPQEGLITVSFFTDGKVVETSVKDNGVGITRDDMSHLFHKFGRLDNSYVAAATAGGTGLGLYICKSLTELMKGKIWAESGGENKGTTFTFTLPAAIPEVIANAENYSKKSIGEAKVLEPVTV